MIPADKESAQQLFRRYGTKSVVPLDEVLGISSLPFKMSVNLMLECAFWAQNQQSYEAAEHALRRVLNLKINDDTIRMVSNEVGRIVFEQDCRHAAEAIARYDACKLRCTRSRPGVLYIELDGAALNTRHKNEEGSSWRENKLGIVFSSDNIRYNRNARTGKLEHSIQKREYVSFLGGVEEFKKHLLSCALKNGYGEYSRAVILSDGASWIARIATELFGDAQHILDFFHLCENVFSFAKELFQQDEAKYAPWATRISEMLKEGRSREVLNELDSLPKIPNRRCVDLAHYIRFHQEHIDYPQYLADGLFIGIGAIESGNKVVLQKRLKQAGMRWDAKTAQYLLTLKAKEESGLWKSEVVPWVMKHYGLCP